MNLRSLHNWVSGIWFIHEIFIEKLLRNDVAETSKIISPIFGSILLGIGFYYLLFNQTEKKFKSIEEITVQDNLGNYLQVFFIMMIVNFEYFHPIGTMIEIGIYGICLLLILVVLFKEWSTKKELLSGVIIGHLILGYFIFNWSKNNYLRHYGNALCY